MPKKKNVIQSAIDNIREALQVLPIAKVFARADKRSVKHGKKLTREISKEFTDTEVATALEISRQKYTALKTKIKKGKVAGADINDMLEFARDKVRETSFRPRDGHGIYTTTEPMEVYDPKKKKKVKRSKFNIDFQIFGETWGNKNLKWVQPIKRTMFLSDALNWLGGVTGGKEYFALRKSSKYKNKYDIVDLRTPGELAKKRKGGLTGILKAQRIIDQYKIDDDMEAFEDYDDEEFEE